MSCSATIPSLGLPGQVMTAVQSKAVVQDIRQLADRTLWMQLDCPEIARQILPGQFFMLRPQDGTDPLLGRPFALLDVYRDEDNKPLGIEFGYVTVGKFTNILAGISTWTNLEIWGPLGNGFPIVNGGHLAIVAGGIGQTPFVAVIREALGEATYGSPARSPGVKPRKISFCYGARSKSLLAGVDDWFRRPGVDVHLATDDGSVGHHGYVTQLLQKLIASDDPPTAVYCCGPEPMMHAVQKITMQANIPAWLSLETPMACGFGACFSCVAPIRQDDGEWDYKRVCVEGPIFPADRVVFDV
jgi:dihydroorotate dehydrogenase electron transfer subunit